MTSVRWNNDLDAVVLGQALLHAGSAGPGSLVDGLRTVLALLGSYSGR